MISHYGGGHGLGASHGRPDMRKSRAGADVSDFATIDRNHMSVTLLTMLTRN
jgi:hypothetical protein